MASSEARRQKQLAKKKAKREEKRSQLIRQSSDNPIIRLAAAASWPVMDALVPDDLWKQGIGTLVLSRRCPDGRVAFAGYLVDTYCLGAKNAYWKIAPESEYRNHLQKVRRVSRMVSVAPEYFAKVVNDAVEYAKSFGFPPHQDYGHARMLLEGIDASACSDTFEFGKDGKPFFINGPFDSEEKIKVIMQRVQQAGGNFLVGVGPPGALGIDADELGENEMEAQEH
jgi:hypothetical protein